MEDKAFELLEKMYNQFSERFDKIENNFNNKFNKLETILENDIKPNINALLDGYKQVYEKQLEHDKRLDVIESKLVQQDVEIRVIKGGK